MCADLIFILKTWDVKAESKFKLETQSKDSAVVGCSLLQL